MKNSKISAFLMVFLAITLQGEVTNDKEENYLLHLGDIYQEENQDDAQSSLDATRKDIINDMMFAEGMRNFPGQGTLYHEFKVPLRTLGYSKPKTLEVLFNLKRLDNLIQDDDDQGEYPLGFLQERQEKVLQAKKSFHDAFNRLTAK